MPITHIKCPDCGGYLHTDDLLESECVTPGCGEQFDEQFYKENEVNRFYNPHKKPYKR